ncbi:MAG: nucleotide exchange factor GrpE [Elusimicrobiales bacterium]
MNSEKDKEDQPKISKLSKDIKQAKQEFNKSEREKTDLEKEIEELKKKNEEYFDQLLRLKAEFENYRKRVEREKSELTEWVKYDIMLSLLSLYDMFRMAKNHISESPSDIENLKVGLNMIFSEFDKLFKSMGLLEIDILNKEYDPMTCEIIETVEGDDESDGKVVEVIQPGYKINNHLLRPAKVKVARKHQDLPNSSTQEGSNKKETKT